MYIDSQTHRKEICWYILSRCETPYVTQYIAHAYVSLILPQAPALIHKSAFSRVSSSGSMSADGRCDTPSPAPKLGRVAASIPKPKATGWRFKVYKDKMYTSIYIYIYIYIYIVCIYLCEYVYIYLYTYICIWQNYISICILYDIYVLI